MCRIVYIHAEYFVYYSEYLETSFRITDPQNKLCICNKIVSLHRARYDQRSSDGYPCDANQQIWNKQYVVHRSNGIEFYYHPKRRRKIFTALQPSPSMSVLTRSNIQQSVEAS